MKEFFSLYLWLIINLMSLLLAWIGIIIKGISENKNNIKIGTILTIVGIYFYAISICYTGCQFNSKRFTIKTEIRQKVVNDSIVKSDTIYKIIPKYKLK